MPAFRSRSLPTVFSPGVGTATRRLERRANSTKRCVWNMKVLKEKLGQDVYNNIFFIHAILGCDTTSRLHGIGKETSLKNFCENHHFLNQAKCSTTHLHQRRKLLKLVRRLWFTFTMVNLAKPWIVLDTDDIVKR